MTQTNPPEFMSSTLQELGIGTYQNVAMVGGQQSYVSAVIIVDHCYSYLPSEIIDREAWQNN